MKSWDKCKALERLYAELSKVETDPRYNYNSQPYQTMPLYVNLFTQDIAPILDVLSKAIAWERS